MAELHRFGKLLAVDADFPGEQTIGIDFGFAEFIYRGFVAARQSIEREVPVLVQPDEVIMPLGGGFRFGIQRVGHVLHHKRSLTLEVRAQIGRQRVDSLVDDDALPIATPGVSAGRQQRDTHGDGKAGVETSSQRSQKHALHLTTL